MEYFTLTTSGKKDYFRFVSSATKGDPDLYLYDKSLDKKHLQYSGDNCDVDYANKNYNFDATYLFKPDQYYIGVFAFDNSTTGTITVSHKKHSVSKVIQSNGYYEKKCSVCGYVASKGYCKPAAPSVTVKNTSTKTITISYAKAKYATKYQIQYSTYKSFKSAKKITTKSVKYKVKKLKKGKTYYVRVRSVNKGGTSAWSKVKKVKIKK